MARAKTCEPVTKFTKAVSDVKGGLVSRQDFPQLELVARYDIAH